MNATTAKSWPRRILIAGLIWGMLVLVFGYVSDPTRENLTYLFAIPGSGLYTLLLYRTRRRWLPLLARRPLRNAMLLGIVNAAVIEALFLILQTLFGAQGIAAHPNLLLDWLITMPWYIGMVVLFVRVQNRWRFATAVVLLLGAVYETGADGTVGGQIVPLIIGDPVNLVETWVFLAALAFWQFIPVYSSMVLPPAWVIETLPTPRAELRAMRAILAALTPLLWLIPYTAYVIVVLVIIAGTPG